MIFQLPCPKNVSWFYSCVPIFNFLCGCLEFSDLSVVLKVFQNSSKFSFRFFSYFPKFNQIFPVSFLYLNRKFRKNRREFKAEIDKNLKIPNLFCSIFSVTFSQSSYIFPANFCNNALKTLVAIGHVWNLCPQNYFQISVTFSPKI